MTPYEVYCLFLAIKRHFTDESYDAFKYNFKIRTSIGAFERRNDRYFFVHLAKQPDPRGFLLAACTRSDARKLFIGSLVREEKFFQYYKQYKAYVDGTEYFFCKELSTLQKSDIVVKGGHHPPIVDKYYAGEISLETLCILHKETNVLDYWNRRIRDVLIWPDLALKIQKYTPFLSYTKRPIFQAIKDRFEQDD